MDRLHVGDEIRINILGTRECRPQGLKTRVQWILDVDRGFVLKFDRIPLSPQMGFILKGAEEIIFKEDCPRPFIPCVALKEEIKEEESGATQLEIAVFVYAGSKLDEVVEARHLYPLN